MFNRYLAGAMMAAWCLTASGTAVRASGTGVETGDAWFGGRPIPLRCELQGDPELVDGPTGLRIRLSEAASGSIQVEASLGGLSVLKRVAANGDVTFSLHGAGEAVSVVATRAAITAYRGRKSVTWDLATPGTAQARNMAVLLAGSPALRSFRTVLGRVAESTRASFGGMALELGDVLLRTLQDDPLAPGQWRRAHLQQGPRPQEGDSCYQTWETEVLGAWTDYEGCYNDFSWWSGGREGCAVLYVIRVESAWFTMIGCSAIPLK